MRILVQNQFINVKKAFNGEGDFMFPHYQSPQIKLNCHQVDSLFNHFLNNCHDIVDVFFCFSVGIYLHGNLILMIFPHFVVLMLSL